MTLSSQSCTVAQRTVIVAHFYIMKISMLGIAMTNANYNAWLWQIIEIFDEIVHQAFKFYPTDSRFSGEINTMIVRA